MGPMRGRVVTVVMHGPLRGMARAPPPRSARLRSASPGDPLVRQQQPTLLLLLRLLVLVFTVALLLVLIVAVLCSTRGGRPPRHTLLPSAPSAHPLRPRARSAALAPTSSV
jgi:hypothetical protein